jgi:hypothetical protein
MALTRNERASSRRERGSIVGSIRFDLDVALVVYAAHPQKVVLEGDGLHHLSEVRKRRRR